jgi:NAD(P)-dependent dehydrogenase (short-subunit alcohol dehydrogenase family)
MPTIAVVGAGPGMGLAIARVFGTKGFDVALISRSLDKLERLAAGLATDGVNARGFAGDVLDPDTLTSALTAATEHFGGIDVLEYSPGGGTEGLTITTPSQTTQADVQQQMAFNLYGAIAATRAVLPGMLKKGAGTLLYTSGGGSVNPVPMLGNINAAGAALRNWVINLHRELADSGIQAAHVAINVWIGAQQPEDFPTEETPWGPTATADQIAPVYWELHTTREAEETVFSG